MDWSGAVTERTQGYSILRGFGIAPQNEAGAEGVTRGFFVWVDFF